MNVHLTPELRRMIEDEVASGRYSSASEVIREALRLYADEKRWREEVRRKIAEGMADIEAGRLVDGEEAFARVLNRLEERIKQERKTKPA